MTIGTSDGQQFDSEFDMHIARTANIAGSSYQKPDYDYDAAKKAGVKADPQTGHWPDTYKLPSHITFSDESKYHGQAGNEGGHWNQLSDDRWSFTPGATNFQHHSLKEMQDYFKKYETGNVLNAQAMIPHQIPWYAQDVLYPNQARKDIGRQALQEDVDKYEKSLKGIRPEGSEDMKVQTLPSAPKDISTRNPQFNTPKVIKDQSRVPPTMAPGCPTVARW